MKTKYFVGAIVAIMILGIVYYLLLSRPHPSQGETLKIGTLLPLSGQGAYLGERIRNAMELAREDVIAEGVVSDVQLIHEDVCLPKDAVSAVNKLLNLDKVTLIGASFCLIGLDAITPSTEKEKIIVFNTAANPDAELAKTYVFSTNISIKDDARKLAVFAYEKLGARSASIIYFNSSFGEGYRKYFTEEFERRGGNVLSSDARALDDVTNDYRTELTKIKSLNPDVLVTIQWSAGLGALIKQSSELDLKAKLLGHNEGEDPTVLQYAGKAAEGFIVSSLTSALKTKAMNDFEKRFTERFGTPPDVTAESAYDAVRLQAQAFKECGSDSDCMRHYFLNVKDYHGLSGDITISDDKSIQKDTIFKVVKNGQFVPMQ